jgi:hypothetical protein
LVLGGGAFAIHFEFVAIHNQTNPNQLQHVGMPRHDVKTLPMAPGS